MLWELFIKIIVVYLHIIKPQKTINMITSEVMKPIESEFGLFARAIDKRDIPAIKLYLKKEGFEPENLHKFLNENLKNMTFKAKKYAKFKNFEAMLKFCLKSIVSKDELRPNMCVVHYNAERKELCATDAHKLIVMPPTEETFREDLFSENTFICLDELKNIISYNEEAASYKYPYYWNVIPEISDDCEINFTISDANIERMRRYVDVCKLLGHKLTRVKIGKSFLDPAKLLTMIEFMRSVDPTCVINLKANGIAHAHTMELNGYIMLIMPLFSDGDAEMYSLIIEE